MMKLLVIPIVMLSCLFVWVIANSDEAIFAIETSVIVVAATAAFTAVGAGVIVLRRLWMSIGTRRIVPDKNGDLPLLQIGDHYINPNIMPYAAFRIDKRHGLIAESDANTQALVAWRLTSGNFGSVPRDIIREPDEPLSLPQPETRLLGPGEPAPPILVDARNIAQQAL